MQFGQQPTGYAVPAANAGVDARAAFIMKTYVHLVGAVLAFVAIETGLFMSGLAARIVPYMYGRTSWLIVLGAFIAVSWIADRWARSATSKPMQYMGLGLYVVAEAVIFLPLMAIALQYPMYDVLGPAAVTTAIVFGGLTGVVFLTRKDFSFLRGILGVAALAALGVIVCSLLFGFNLGILFSGAMVLLAAGYILYYTSNVLHHYRTDQYVAAALALFSAVALLFWYILRIFLSSRR